MKYRKLLLILAVATLSLTACKKEPTEVPPIEETVESVAEETTTEKVIPEATEETTEIETTVDETTIPEASIVGRLALPNNVTITKWGENQYSGNKQALDCTYSDEWLGAVQEVINTLQDGYIETLSDEKLAELVGEIALNSANVYGEDANDEEVTDTIKEVFKVFRYLNSKEPISSTGKSFYENVDQQAQEILNGEGSGGNTGNNGGSQSNNGGGQSSNGNTSNSGGGTQQPPAQQPSNDGPLEKGGDTGLPGGNKISGDGGWNRDTEIIIGSGGN